MEASINRKARMNALLIIQNESSASPIIIKEASVIGFLKDIFQSFYQGIASQVDKAHPVLSAMNFLTVGEITAFNPILGVIFSVLGSSFGINFTSIFNTIKGTLMPHTNSDQALKNLDDNQDTIIPNAVKSAVDANVKNTDEELDSGLQIAGEKAAETIRANKLEDGIVKQALPFGAATVAKFLPAFSTVFGPGKNWISGLIVWIVKAICLGGGMIGSTTAMASVFGGSPKALTTVDSNQTDKTSTAPVVTTSNPGAKPAEYTSMSQIGQHIFDQLKLAGDPSIVVARKNSAPNNQEEGVDGGMQWMTTGTLWSTLYNWVFSTYANANQVLTENHITPESLKNAAKRLADEFMRVTNYPPDNDSYRIPKEYDNVKDVVDAVIKRATK